MCIVPPDGILFLKISSTCPLKEDTLLCTLDDAAAALVCTARKAFVIAISIFEPSKSTTDPFLFIILSWPGATIAFFGSGCTDSCFFSSIDPVVSKTIPSYKIN